MVISRKNLFYFIVLLTGRTPKSAVLNRARNGFHLIMKYAVLTYANMRGTRSVDRIVELCERDLAFIWLTQGEKPQRDAFYDFINNKLTNEILDDLNYQFLRRLKKEGEVPSIIILQDPWTQLSHSIPDIMSY